MRYKEWQAERDRLEEAKENSARAADAAFDALRKHERQCECLQYTLPTGSRITIANVGDTRLSITAADFSGFLSLGSMTMDDLEALMQIRRHIDDWKNGSVELQMPKKPFDMWKEATK